MLTETASQTAGPYLHIGMMPRAGGIDVAWAEGLARDGRPRGAGPAHPVGRSDLRRHGHAGARRPGRDLAGQRAWPLRSSRRPPGQAARPRLPRLRPRGRRLQDGGVVVRHRQAGCRRGPARHGDGAAHQRRDLRPRHQRPPEYPDLLRRRGRGQRQGPRAAAGRAGEAPPDADRTARGAARARSSTGSSSTCRATTRRCSSTSSARVDVPSCPARIRNEETVDGEQRGSTPERRHQEADYHHADPGPGTGGEGACRPGRVRGVLAGAGRCHRQGHRQVCLRQWRDAGADGGRRDRHRRLRGQDPQEQGQGQGDLEQPEGQEVARHHRRGRRDQSGVRGEADGRGRGGDAGDQPDRHADVQRHVRAQGRQRGDLRAASQGGEMHPAPDRGVPRGRAGEWRAGGPGADGPQRLGRHDAGADEGRRRGGGDRRRCDGEVGLLVRQAVLSASVPATCR